MVRRHARCATVLLAGLTVLVSAAPSGAVVGGSPAPPGRWPWMAAVLHRDVADPAWAQYCGGVVISPRRVLTAAHCAIGKRSTSIDVLIGRTRLTATDGARVHVAAISIYPGFVSRREKSLDAAVLTLASDAGVPAVALARPGDDAAWSAGARAWTMGWGRLNRRRSDGGHEYYADRLRDLPVPIQGDDACESAFGIGFAGFPYRPEWLVCAGTAAGTTGVCYGDSGGPLVVGGPSGWLDVGVASANDSCAARGYFDLYVRVDRVNSFALGARLTAQPDPVSRPSVSGRFAAGAVLRCNRGGWRGDPARFSFRWRRLGDHRATVRGRRSTYRLTRRDARRGVKCAVTAANRGGRVTTNARRVPVRRSPS